MGFLDTITIAALPKVRIERNQNSICEIGMWVK